MVVSGTGHRPNKLGGYSREAQHKLIRLADEYLGIVRPDKVVTGGALGWDQALAYAAISQNLPHVLALPFEGFESKWPRESQEFLYSLMTPSEVVFVCEPGYAAWKMQVRNQWMVDNSGSVVALWDGSDGGTANCVAYANKVGRPVHNLWERYSGL